MLLFTQPSAALEVAVQAYKAALKRGATYSSLPIRPGILTLLKWDLMRREEYDAILFADLDVNVMPGIWATNAAAARHAFAANLPQLVARARGSVEAGRRVRAVFSADNASPINTGQMLLFPSAAIFEDGLRVLEEGSFSIADGWNRSGPLVATLAARPPRRVDGSLVERNCVAFALELRRRRRRPGLLRLPPPRAPSRGQVRLGRERALLGRALLLQAVASAAHLRQKCLVGGPAACTALCSQPLSEGRYPGPRKRPRPNREPSW